MVWCLITDSGRDVLTRADLGLAIKGFVMDQGVDRPGRPSSLVKQFLPLVRKLGWTGSGGISRGDRYQTSVAGRRCDALTQLRLSLSAAERVSKLRPGPVEHSYDQDLPR